MSAANTPTPPLAVTKLISEAQGGIDLLDKAEKNPELDTWLRDNFGPQIMAAASTPFGSLLGMIISWLIAHYGFTIDPTLIPVICGGGILIGHYIQAGIVKAWRAWKATNAPAAPK